MHQRFAVLDNLSTLIALVSNNGQVVYSNSALEVALVSSHRLIVGTPLAQYFQDATAFQNALQAANLQQLGTLSFDAVLIDSFDKALSVYVSASQPEPNAEIWIEMHPQDAQAKQEREQRLSDQAQANKELVRNLAHEIKNPLGGIRGAAQLLEMDLPSPDLKEYTQVIIHESDRLQSLVDRLLAPHRQAKIVSDVNIHEVCERVRSVVLAQYPKGLQIKRDYDVSIPELRADKEQLIQVVLNIAQNACQAMGTLIENAQAQLILKTRIVNQVTLERHRYKLALELHIIDNGPGIEESIKDTLFFPLVSGRDGGSGLGLTIAQTFVVQHGGQIECSSVPGKTDFKILLPLP